MSDSSLASTATLIHRIHNGEEHAKDLLLQRSLPLLKRWARGRLPRYSRDLAETDDLVQLTLIKAMARIDAFEPRRQGSFLAYLRQAMSNAIRNEIRNSRRRPTFDTLDEGIGGGPDQRPPQESIADLEAYEKGLAQLGERPRQAVILRLEFGLTYPEIAEELSMRSADAARMTVARSLVTLARALS